MYCTCNKCNWEGSIIHLVSKNDDSYACPICNHTVLRPPHHDKCNCIKCTCITLENDIEKERIVK